MLLKRYKIHVSKNHIHWIQICDQRDTSASITNTKLKWRHFISCNPIGQKHCCQKFFKSRCLNKIEIWKTIRNKMHICKKQRNCWILFLIIEFYNLCFFVLFLIKYPPRKKQKGKKSFEFNFSLWKEISQ